MTKKTRDKKIGKGHKQMGRGRKKERRNGKDLRRALDRERGEAIDSITGTLGDKRLCSCLVYY
jgi:hypothetical protein